MRTILYINGMMCGMCESHINDAIRKNFDVKKVKSSKRKNQAVVVSNEVLDKEKLMTVIAETGYEFAGMEIK